MRMRMRMRMRIDEDEENLPNKFPGLILLGGFVTSSLAGGWSDEDDEMDCQGDVCFEKYQYLKVSWGLGSKIIIQIYQTAKNNVAGGLKYQEKISVSFIDIFSGLKDNDFCFRPEQSRETWCLSVFRQSTKRFLHATDHESWTLTQMFVQINRLGSHEYIQRKIINFLTPPSPLGG